MKTSDHVTRHQIAAFGAGSLAAGDSRTVGGHLIRCGECRSMLPIPGPAQVWSAVTSEHEFVEPRDTRSFYSQTVVGLFSKRNRLAFAGGMLAVVVGLTTLFIFSISNQQGVESEVARSYELETTVPASTHNQSSQVNAAVLPGSESDSEVQGTNSNSTDRWSPKYLRKPNSRSAATDSRMTSRVQKNIAHTRGAAVPCTVGRTIEVELGSNKSDLVLKWKPVPKAAKYHLYVSDDNEVLVDEFETDRDTSYVLKKALDPARSYKWKIVITLESGEKLYVGAQKFTNKDFQSYFSGHKSKARSNTRCLAN
jgi:hypothetical protein